MKKILTISLLLCLLLPAFLGCTKPEEEMYCAKPVIYLYPQTDKDVTVLLDYNGDLTCTYPEYQNGWQVTAAPDGTLTTPDGKQYNYLYWEGENHFTADFSQGFVVKGEETASFLEEALSQLGLTPREANEFIIYWLPQMQNSPYNLISFQQEAYTQNAILWEDAARQIASISCIQVSRWKEKTANRFLRHHTW